MDPEIGVDIDLNCDISDNDNLSQPQSSKRNTYEPNYVETVRRPSIWGKISAKWNGFNDWLSSTRLGLGFASVFIIGVLGFILFLIFKPKI